MHIYKFLKQHSMEFWCITIKASVSTDFVVHFLCFRSEVNQRLCSSVLPLCFQVVAEDRWRHLSGSLLSFAGLTVAGNGQCPCLKELAFSDLATTKNDKKKRKHFTPKITNRYEFKIGVKNSRHLLWTNLFLFLEWCHTSSKVHYTELKLFTMHIII